MRKNPQVEDGMKSVIKDRLALQPLLSVQNMRLELYKAGYQTAHGFTLVWHYIAKLMRKVRIENIISLSREDRTARLAAVKERHRVLTEKLTEIVEGKPMLTFNGAVYPSQHDRITAANTIMKWDIALLYAEAQMNAAGGEQESKKELTETKTVILMNSISETKKIPHFTRS